MNKSMINEKANEKNMQFEELITPYVQGRLDKEKSLQLEQFAEKNVEFAKRLDFEKQIRQVVQYDAEESVDTVPSFNTLKQRIESDQKRTSWWNIFSWSSNENAGGFRSHLVYASLVAICASIFLIYNTQEKSPDTAAEYETLSNGESSFVLEEGRQYLRVVFTEDVNEARTQSLAKQFSFRLESGPDGMNSYIVSMADADSTESIPQEKLQQLRNDKQFRFVEPLPKSLPEQGNIQ